MRSGAPVAHVSHAAPRSAVKIDDEIEALPPQLARERAVVADAREAAWPLDDSTRSSMCGMMAHDRFGGGLDEIGDAGIREAALESANDRRGEDDVADQAEPDEQNGPRTQGSIVASSISITGMSSLIGYTR